MAAFGPGLCDAFHAGDHWAALGDGILYDWHRQARRVAFLTIPGFGYPDGVRVGWIAGHDIAEAAGRCGCAGKKGPAIQRLHRQTTPAAASTHNARYHLMGPARALATQDH